MGIYVFSFDKLKKYLKMDSENPDSDNDFGKNIIPLMLKSKEKLMTYNFCGYWKDVGTVGSFWEANLDLLNPKINLDLSSDNLRIYSRNIAYPPQFANKDAKIENSLVSDGCEISGRVDYSVIFENVTVEKGASVEYSLVMPGSVIKSGASVKYSVIAENCIIKENAKVGKDPDEVSAEEFGITVVGSGEMVDKKGEAK